MNDTKRIALLVGLVLWAIFALSVSVRAEELTSPKCGDEVALNIPVQKKMGTSHRVTGSEGGFGGSVPAAASTPCQGADPSDCTWRESFEGTTACYGAIGNYCDNAWTWMASGWNPHYSTAPFEGTYSAYATDTANEYMIDVITSADEYYASAIVSIPDVTDQNASWTFGLMDSENNVLCQATHWDNLIYGNNTGGTDLGSPLSVSADQKFYVMVRAKKGTGANAECEIWASTTTTWGSPQETTDGTWTAQIAEVFVRKQYVAGTKTDDLRVYTGAIAY